MKNCMICKQNLNCNILGNFQRLFGGAPPPPPQPSSFPASHRLFSLPPYRCSRTSSCRGTSASCAPSWPSSENGTPTRTVASFPPKPQARACQLYWSGWVVVPQPQSPRSWFSFLYAIWKRVHYAHPSHFQIPQLNLIILAIMSPALPPLPCLIPAPSSRILFVLPPPPGVLTEPEFRGLLRAIAPTKPAAEVAALLEAMDPTHARRLTFSEVPPLVHRPMVDDAVASAEGGGGWEGAFLSAPGMGSRCLAPLRAIYVSY